MNSNTVADISARDFETRVRDLQRYKRQGPQEPEKPLERLNAADMVTAMLDRIEALATASGPTGDEYTDEADGILHCRVCGGAKQTRIAHPITGEKRVVPCVCDCVKREREAQKERDRRDAADRARSTCFQGTNMHRWNFANDDHKRPELSAALQKYADEFPQYYKQSQGLLLHGPVGTGKTFFAACVANAVIDLGYKALMTNFANVANTLWSVKDREAYIKDLVKYDLLILDDLGAERKNSDFMQEIVFNVIDARYRAGGPVIVTTNLTPDELTQSAEMGYSRIYDRILERCLAVKVDGASRRRQTAAKSWAEMRKQLGMEVRP